MPNPAIHVNGSRQGLPEPIWTRDFTLQFDGRALTCTGLLLAATGGTDGLQVTTGADGSIACLVGADGTWGGVATGPTRLGDGQWHQVVLSRAGQQLALWLDGTAIPAAEPPPDPRDALPWDALRTTAGQVRSLVLFQGAHTPPQLPADPLARWVFPAPGAAAPGALTVEAAPAPQPGAPYPAPVMTEVLGYPSGKVSLQWNPVQGSGVSRYNIKVFHGQTQFFDGYTGATRVTLNLALQSGATYTVQVCAMGSQGTGDFSDPLPILRDAPTAFTATPVAGALDCSWSDPGRASGYRVAVFTGSTMVGHVDTTETRATVPVPTDPHKTYAVQVCEAVGTDAVSRGPWSAALRTCAAPVMQSVQCDGTTTQLWWSAVTAPGVSGYTVVVDQGTNRIYNGSTSASNAKVTLALVPGQPYTVAVQAGGAGIQGVWSEAIPLVTGAPTGLAAAVAADITGAWDTLGTPGYRMHLLDGSTEVSRVDVDTLSAHLAIPTDKTRAYGVQVAGLAGPGGISSGPYGATVGVILQQPNIRSVEYDGANIHVAWQAVTVGPVTGYTVALLQAQHMVYEGHTTATQAAISVALQPDLSYTVQVLAVGTSTRGPWSDAIWVIMAVPEVEGLAYDGRGTTVSLQVPQGPGMIGVRGQVLVNGRPTYVSHSPTVPLVIPGELDAAQQNAVQVQAYGNRTTGPWSAPAPIFLVQVTGLRAATDGTHITARWDPATGADGYEAQLAANGVWGAAQGGQQTQVVFPEAMAAGVVYTVRVRTCSGADRGPWTPPAPGPYLRSGAFAYDGLGRLQTATFPGVATTTFTHDPWGNITTVQVTATPGGGSPGPDANRTDRHVEAV